MINFPHTLARYALVAAIILIGQVIYAESVPPLLASMSPATSRNCEDVPHSDHPHARITNGTMNAVVFLPDLKNGYYRAARFDWSGIVACASLNGHTFFGEWFDHYSPMTNDAVTGPSEEFREPLGYDAAKPGEEFVKVGVGVLKRIDNQPYKIGTPFTILDHGRWKVRVHKNSIIFRQELRSSLGYAYVYEKVLSLDKRSNVLHIAHRLKNIGTKAIDTTVYPHDFFMLDNKTTGPAMQVHFPFVPVPSRPYPDTVRLEGMTIKWLAQMQPHKYASGEMTGFSSKVSDFDFTFQDLELGIGVEETSDSPLAKAFFWSTPTTVCPEGFVGIHVKPGETQRWNIYFRFFTK
jgi:hypothetical protein